MNIEDIFERENIDKQHTVKHICNQCISPLKCVVLSVGEGMKQGT